jgi:PAS domain S-box-containing protein
MLNNLIELGKAPIFPGDEEKTRRARALNALYINTAFTLLLLGGAGVLFFFKEKFITSSIVLICLFVSIVGTILNRRGHVKIAASLLLFTLWIVTVFTTSISGGVRSFDALFFVSGTVIAGITLGAGGGVFYAILSLLTSLTMVFLENNGVTFPQLFTFPAFSAWIILFINLALTVIPMQVAFKSLADSATRAQASEESYRLIASVTSDYAFHVRYGENEEPQEQWIKGAFETITGYTPEEYFEHGGWRSILYPEDLNQDDRGLDQLRHNKKVVADFRIIRKDGETRWVRSYANPLWDEKNNRLAGIYGAVQDINEQKNIQNSLRQRETILDAVAASAEKLFKSSNWRDELDSVLYLLGKSINASHAYFFENRIRDNGRIYTTMISEWTAPGFASDLGSPKYTEVFVSEDDLQSWYINMKDGLPYIGDKKRLNEADYNYLVERNILALLDVPIHIDNQWWGSLGFDDMAIAREWTAAEVDALIVAGNVLSAAIKRQIDETALQEELNQRKLLIAELEHRNAVSETLHESAAIVVATLEQSEAIARILEQLEKVVYFDSASVQLLRGDVLEIVSARGFDFEDDALAKQFVLNKDEPSYLVVKGIMPYVLYEDVQTAVPSFNQTPHYDIHAWMAVPLKVKGRVIGIIAMDGKQIGQFNEKDAKLAVTYANQVAIAVENSRLFNEVQVELKIRQKLIDELEAKNAELERFTYTVSHDLRSPLVTIKGYLGYIEKSAHAGNLENLLKDIKRVSNATDRMEVLLKDLLQLSRIGRLVNKPQEIPFEDIVKEAAEIIHGRLEEKGIALHIHPNLPAIHGDKARLVEVMQNLMDNAAKYTGDQREPVIEVGVNGWEENNIPVFFVRDNGMGIHPEYQDRIFGLFEKLDTSTEGTGIGLALVKRIIEFHGGRIWVESEPGKGSTFHFTIPNKK